MAGSEGGLARIAGKLFALVAAALATYLALLFMCGRTGEGSDRYLAAQLDKVALLQRTQSPRLILIGGSHAAFSIDSARLGEGLGVAVVNMGLHGGLGLKYMLDAAWPLLREGDLVVVVPEYEQLVGRQFDGSKELLELFFITRDWDVLWRLKPTMLLEANQTIVDFAPGRPPQPPYVRSGFDRHGDMVAHLGMPARPINRSALLGSRLDDRAIVYLADFMQRCERRGVRALFLPPSIARTDFELNGAMIARIDARLRRSMARHVAARPDESVYDDGAFYDSVYHMNAWGRAQRTNRMIEVIGAWRRDGGTAPGEGRVP
jgi:hypothetical protein